MRVDGFGNVDVDAYFDGDPVDDWLSLKRREDVAENTVERTEQFLKSNGNGTALQQFLHDRDVDVLDATVVDLFDYRDFIREVNNERELKNKLAAASTFYTQMREFNQTDSNPAAFVIARTEFDFSSPDRDHHTVSEIAEYLKSIPRPKMLATALLLLKYGLRRGEVVNLDLCCVHIDDQRYLEFLEERGIELHDEVKDHPDSIFIYGKFNKGDVIAGEERQVGNKRENSIVVPIDEELKHALLQYLTVRPLTDSPHPLFTTLKPIGNEYSRQSPSSLYNYLIRKIAIECGLAQQDDNRSDVDLHYFRHFFCTQMKRHYGDHDGHIHEELLKYIRGDKMEDEILEVYTHDWVVNVREPYLDNIYTFGLFE